MKRVPLCGLKGADKGTQTLKKGEQGRLWVLDMEGFYGSKATLPRTGCNHIHWYL